MRISCFLHRRKDVFCRRIRFKVIRLFILRQPHISDFQISLLFIDATHIHCIGATVFQAFHHLCRVIHTGVITHHIHMGDHTFACRRNNWDASQECGGDTQTEQSLLHSSIILSVLAIYAKPIQIASASSSDFTLMPWSFT